MTWLAPTQADRDLVDRIEALNPALYRLGLVLATALRIEPLLLRNARLRFLPQSDAGLESELWFSPLVSSRSARSVLLRPGVARLLTERLTAAQAPFQYEDVWAFIEDQTRHWPPEEHLEQALRQAARRGDTTALCEGLRTALRRIAVASGNNERRDLARWLKGALPALGGMGQGPIELDLAAAFAAAALGDPGGTLGQRMTRGEALPNWLRTFVPSGKTSQLGLRLWPGVLEVLPADEVEHRIDLGAPSPAPLHIRCEHPSGHQGRWEPCWPGRRIPLPPGCTTLTLTTLSGARYRLAARPGQAPPPDEPGHPAFDRPVLVAHHPEDSAAAERVVRLLKSAGIEATLIPESAAARAPSPGDAVLLRLWTQAAYRRSAVGEAPAPVPVRGLVLRMDDTPLIPNAEAQDVIDLSAWRGDPEAETARELLHAIRGLSGARHEEPEPQPRIRIFISYRRRDSGEIASRIRDRLRLHFGPASVFTDLSSVQPEQDLQQAIEQRIRGSDVVLAIVGPRWLTEGDAARRKGLHEPKDFVHMELSIALRGGRPVVPVLIDEAKMPLTFSLPEDLTPLTHRQAIEIRSRRFDEDIDRLVEVLEGIAGELPNPPQSGKQPDLEIEPLLVELDDPETPPERRLAIGDRLAELGDPRPGVGLNADGVPDIDWVGVPGGAFLFGNDKRRERTDAFRIARYPITNAQYQAFIDSGGYREDRWWAGLAQRIEAPADPDWPHPNRPRTNVAWYEAVAFCRWLSSQVGLEIRLPTEIEWEKAARGTDGREYPWGDGYQSGIANTDERASGAGRSYLGQTTAVGVYPHGASPYGVLDLAGNAWDWCLNKWYRQEDTETEREEQRVVRGGSWYNNRNSARSADRDWSDPDDHGNNLGFRVLCASPS
ncbi:SUMF1/EgtB/PvdO family nonheme iron enzyme [Thiocapsa rosea]|uniref:Formylglycine-generating enzyme required for sulfatase activity n=1 Tax=Thiocapsa rosea TaxID=69360 RepID=A0A495VB66_9GAMM|nr:SUMF1/EgtB/PvdO family nonheme iron enzyme [Thiocapsa rosea]RKT46636.1 formylglycine-generating enzyme required for sulfatase activity [Thiocapsa rosea]